MRAREEDEWVGERKGGREKRGKYCLCRTVCTFPQSILIPPTEYADVRPERTAEEQEHHGSAENDERQLPANVEHEAKAGNELESSVDHFGQVLGARHLYKLGVAPEPRDKLASLSAVKEAKLLRQNVPIQAHTEPCDDAFSRHPRDGHVEERESVRSSMQAQD
jgi:hypothetical protein